MKTAVVMQPYFFPYLGYFQLVAASSVFVFLDDTTFIKGGWINRNRCLVQGKAHLFTVPLCASSSNRSIATTLVTEDFRWRSRLLRLLEQTYARAPLRDPVLELVEQVISTQRRSIGDLAAASVRAVCAHVGLSTTWQSSSEAHPAQGHTGAERIIDICRALRATRYVNAPGGRELYTSTEFARAGIELRFLRPTLRAYAQTGGGFVSGLSIIDVLMFNPPEQVRAWMGAYELE